jgi:hypothetical protein
MAVKLRKLSLNLPFNLGGVEMEVSDAEARAAWALYVELATRVSAHPLAPGAGSAAEALASLHSVFASTREILRASGTEVAQTPDSLGPIAIRMLNDGLRPFVVKWHTELRTESDLTGERRTAFDEELATLRVELERYVQALAQIAGITR